MSIRGELLTMPTNQKRSVVSVMHEVADELGWDDGTYGAVLERFVEERGLVDELVEFLARVKAEESGR
jgi:hypothetical protein